MLALGLLLVDAAGCWPTVLMALLPDDPSPSSRTVDQTTITPSSSSGSSTASSRAAARDAWAGTLTAVAAVATAAAQQQQRAGKSVLSHSSAFDFILLPGLIESTARWARTNELKMR